jgi:queuine tRNA-ribosyltransferase
MFKIEHTCGNARSGILKTKHGKIKTPFFMPVVTKGASKLLTFPILDELGTQCFISNAYLLYLKPGMEVITETKGYHNFINWKKSIFSDSGGFQLLNPDFLISINNKGVKFRDPFSGDIHFISPEELIKIQNIISSDIAMVLDHLLGPNGTYEEHKIASERTIDWAKRAIENHKNKDQLLFGIVQGGVFKDLRNYCAQEINKLPFDGLAIGGLAIGESKEKMYQAIDYSLEYLDKNRPRYLMGVGSPEDIIISIGKGVDCFDSIYPTKMARHGVVFTNDGQIKIWKGKYKHIYEPLEKECDCPTCKNHTIAYLHHLYRAKEPNAKLLLSIHNIRFMHRLVENARKHIEQGTYDKFQKEFLENYINK